MSNFLLAVALLVKVCWDWNEASAIQSNQHLQYLEPASITCICSTPITCQNLWSSRNLDWRKMALTTTQCCKRPSLSPVGCRTSLQVLQRSRTNVVTEERQAKLPSCRRRQTSIATAERVFNSDLGLSAPSKGQSRAARQSEMAGFAWRNAILLAIVVTSAVAGGYAQAAETGLTPANAFKGATSYICYH